MTPQEGIAVPDLSPSEDRAVRLALEVARLCVDRDKWEQAFLASRTELDELHATVEAVRALADEWAARAPEHYTPRGHAEVVCERELRALLPPAEPTEATS